MAGIVYDNIKAQHIIHFGIPQPTQSGEPKFKASGVYNFDLAQFPKNVLPSGGLTGVVSVSEMVMVAIQAWDYIPKNDAVTFEWRYGDKLIASTKSGDFDERGLEYYYTFDYSFIGHFRWEIQKTGTYSVTIKTSWGEAKIDFDVYCSKAGAK